MPTLEQIYLDNLPRFDACAQRLKAVWDDLLIPDRRDHPLYIVKYRVKTFQSIKGKLYKILEDDKKDEEQKGLARHLLGDGDDIALSQLFELIQDIVGVRVVLFFYSDTRELIGKVDKGLLSPWLTVRDIKEYSPLYQVGLEFLRAQGAGAPLSANMGKQSGYSSTHLIVEFSKRQSPFGSHAGLVCEVQIRSMLEEAWGDLSHWLDYKGGVQDTNTHETLKTVKTHLDGLDLTFNSIQKNVLELRAAASFRYRIQLWHHYEYTPPDSLPKAVIDGYKQARNDYLAGNFVEAHREFQSLAKMLAPRSDDEARSAKTRFLYYQALQCLYMDTKRGMAAAAKLLKEVLRREKKYALAYLRLAHIAEQSQEYDLAIEYCNRAVAQLEKNSWHVPGLSTRGLQGDVRAYLGVLHFARAEDYWKSATKHGRNAGGVPSTVRRELRQAIEETVRASGHTDDVPIVEQRCANNLAYYHTKLGQFAKAQRYAAKLDEATNDPRILDTLGWLAYCSGVATTKGLELVDRAVMILQKQGGSQRVRMRFEQRIRDHLLHVKNGISGGRPYQIGDEYSI